MKRAIVSVCLAVACIAATTCKAEEPSIAWQDYAEESVVAAYFVAVCSRYVEAEDAAGFLDGYRPWAAGDAFQRRAYDVLLTSWGDGLTDAGRERFDRDQCARLLPKTFAELERTRLAAST